MNEFDFIGKLLRPLAVSDEAAGLRDDVAVLRQGATPTIITTDTLVEGRHFRVGDPWQSVGQKLVRVNVSDCYAKGALPRACTFNLTWRNDCPAGALHQLIEGLKADLESFGIALIGGDTTSHDGAVVLSLTLIGDCQLERGPVRRTSGRIGDDLWVSGTIGDAYLGLKYATPTDADQAQLNQSYLVPLLPPPLIATMVARFATASMDVSDGLLADSERLAEASCCGAEIRLFDIPLSPSAVNVVSGLDETKARLQLSNGGDDYQVLFAAEPTERQSILEYAKQAGLSVARVGCLVETSGLRCLDEAGRPLEVLTQGWEHQLFL